MYRLLPRNCNLPQRLLAVFLCLGILPSSHAAGAEQKAPIIQFPDTATDFIDDAMRYLGLNESSKRDLFAGKVLFSGMPDMEALDEQLTVAGMMLIINRPMRAIAERLLNGDVFRESDKLIDFGLITDKLSVDGVTSSTFRNVSYTTLEKTEVDKLLQVRPGTQFNLSNGELARFQALDADSDSIIEDVSGLYRDILLQRCLSYMQEGLPGIVDYQRKKNAVASPSKELAVATETAWFIKKHFQDFHQIITSFPGSTQEGTYNRFYWMKQTISGRPHLALSHNIIKVSENYVIALDVQYYSSHNYNAVHTLVLLVPADDNTLVLSSNRSFTDQVLGFGSKQKRKVGRRIVAKLMADKFTRLKSMVERDPVTKD